MNAPSDGAIVVTIRRPADDYEPTKRELLRYHLPDIFLALCIGTIAGAYFGDCIFRATH